MQTHGRHIPNCPRCRAEERRSAPSVRIQPSSVLDNVERLENRLSFVNRDDRRHVRRDGSEDRTQGPKRRDDGDLKSGGRRLFRVPRHVGDVDRERRPRRHARVHRGRDGEKVCGTGEARSFAEDGRLLVTGFVDAPGRHGDGDDREGDTLQDEKGLKFPWVDEAQRELEDPE